MDTVGVYSKQCINTVCAHHRARGMVKVRLFLETYLLTALLNPSYLQNQTIDYLQYNTCKTHLHPWPDTYAAKHYKLIQIILAF